MRQNRDVMRSDRLKQVMQEIDPNFDEKDVGFSRFSKFVQEASSRGLLRLTKLDNGQFEVDLGTNANVPPGTELPPAAPSPEPRHSDPGRRRRGREGDRATQTREAKGTTLAQAFELLRQILLDLGAIGDESTDAEQVRERMVEKLGENDPIVGGPRFQRLLRQAHDASLIELVKQGEDAYLLELTPGGTVTAEHAVPAAEAAESAEAVEVIDEGEPQSQFLGTDRPAGEERRPRDRGGRDRGERGRGRGGRGRERGGRGRGRGREGDRPRGEGERSRDHSPSTTGEHRAAPGGGETRSDRGGDSRRNVRFRSGSRRPGPSGSPAEEGQGNQAAPPPATPSAPAAPPVTTSGHRSLRGRQGSSALKPQRPAASDAPSAPSVPVERSEPAARPAPEATRRPVDPPPPPRNEPRVARSTPATEDEPRSLFKRLSGALQKALGTPEKEGDE
jgi:hypothetical protein